LLQVGLLGQRRDKADMALEAFTTAPPSPESWLVDQRLAPAAITLSAEQPLPGMGILARFGQAAVIRRAERIDPAALNPLTIRYRASWDDQRLQTAIELQRSLPGPLPLLEICLYHNGSQISAFTLPPEPERTRTQYLGAALLPGTLGAEGYINQSAYPSFAPLSHPPTGALSLTLRLALAGNTVDERLLATFERTADGRFERLTPSSGELIYLRRDSAAGDLRAVDLDFENALRLTGWSGPARAAPRDTVMVRLRWQAPRPLDRSLFTEIQLLDGRGQPLATNLAAPQDGFYPTWRWRSGESVTEQRSLQLPPNLTPGVYYVAVRVCDFVDGRALSADGGDADGVTRMGELLVE
jgi:hypothetical protein